LQATDKRRRACGLAPEGEGDEAGSPLRKLGVVHIHSTLPLIGFYGKLGFEPIPEARLPTSIRERFLFCFGEMAGCNVAPMMRSPGPG